MRGHGVRRARRAGGAGGRGGGGIGGVPNPAPALPAAPVQPAVPVQQPVPVQPAVPAPGAAQGQGAAGQPLIMPQATRDHIINGRFTGRYISGCHNQNNFLQMIHNQPGLALVGAPRNGGLGISEYSYQYNGGPVRLKTVYDPTVYPDAVMIAMAEQAAQNGNRNGTAFTGNAGGITFNGYIDGNTIKTSYPVI